MTAQPARQSSISVGDIRVTYLPDGEGMFRFTTLEQAAAALDAINADYERHCRAARDIAAAYFDAERVVAGILNEALP